MHDSALPLIFDGHNDVLLRLFNEGGVEQAGTFVSGRTTHIDVPKSRAGGFAGGFFAIYVPPQGEDDDREQLMKQASYDVPLPPRIECADALPIVLQQAAILSRLEEIGALKICTSVAEIRSCMVSGILAAIMHVEGCEGIDEDLHSLDVLYRAGLRSVGPVWSRTNQFGEGVPFRFPSSPDTGSGLTPLGVKLVKRCSEKRIMVDLSHITEAGFWDVAKHTALPLVATHSNVHSLCEHSRNLTDKQLTAIAESDGMVGLNFATPFLREDGRERSDVELDIMLRHLDHLISILGEDRVGIGSDFDGTLVPDAIGDVAGLGALRDAMRIHGYNEELMAKLCHSNWLNLLERTWGTR